MPERLLASFPGASVYLIYDGATNLVTAVRSTGRTALTLDNGTTRLSLTPDGRQIAISAALGFSVNLVDGKERGPLAIATSWSP